MKELAKTISEVVRTPMSLYKSVWEVYFLVQTFSFIFFTARAYFGGIFWRDIPVACDKKQLQPRKGDA